MMKFLDSLTSHTTARDSTETKNSSLLGESLKPDQTQDISIHKSTPESITESQVSSCMPYLESTDQTEMTKKVF